MSYVDKNNDDYDEMINDFLSSGREITRCPTRKAYSYPEQRIRYARRKGHFTAGFSAPRGL